MVVTHSKEMADSLRLYRNHGLVNRDEISTFGVNCRLDTLQAVVGNRLIDEAGSITDRRIANAQRYDEAFLNMEDYIQIPVRRSGVKHVYHLYVIRAAARDELLTYLQAQGVEAKIHYPIPLHLQEASRSLGYKEGDFPVAEADAKKIITLPAHQHLTPDEIQHTIAAVRTFYAERATT